MMTLPIFTNQDITTTELWTEQARLKSQAQKMMNHTQIFNIFSKHGELSDVGGSYKYNLMVYPDIDIGLTATKVDKQTFAGLVAGLTASIHVRTVHTADSVNFESVHSGRPKGYWVGLEIPFEGERWGIDCWLQQPDWTLDDKDVFYDALLKLDQPGKDAILHIKYDLIRLGVYGKTIFSNDVYDAVLNNDIQSVKDFHQLTGLLKSHNI